MKKLYSEKWLLRQSFQKSFMSLIFLVSLGMGALKAQVWNVPYCSQLPSVTQSSTYGPMYSVATANATSRTAVIYPASQLSGILGSNITSVYFHTGNANASGMLGTPNFKIYLKEVTAVDWGTGSLDWATASAGATLVFDGNPAPIIGTSGGWKQFPLSSPFSYSGTQNLAVLMEYSNPSASNSITWSYEYTAPCVDTSNSNSTKYSNNTTGTLATALATSNYRRPYIAFDIPVSCPAPTGLTVTGQTATSVSLSWTAPATAPAAGYDIFYSTTNTIPATPATNVAGTSTTVNGLNSGTVYYFWIKARCSASDQSFAVGSVTATTDCVAKTAPYSENFDSTSTGTSTNNNAPVCWSYLETAGSAGYGYVSTTSSVSAPNGYYLYNSSDVTGNIMLVSPQTTNLSDGLKWVRFSARTTSGNTPVEVGTLSNPLDPTTFTLISSIPLTTTFTEYTAIIPAGSNQYLAFRHGLGGTFRSVYLDNIVIENTPTCFEPTSVAVTTKTANSVTLSWTAPASGGAPQGYTIYYSTTNTAPTSGTVLNATNSVTVTGTTGTVAGLQPSTSYYFWVRSNCSPTDSSAWIQAPVVTSTNCQPPAITSVTGQTVCLNNTATLTAAAPAGATVNWYAAATGGTPLATGNSFTTPALTTTTTYYVSAGTGSSANVGKTTIESGASASGGSLSSYMVFTAHSDFTLLTVDLFPYSSVDGTAGTVTIELQTDSGTPITSTTVNVVGHNSVSNSVPQTVALNFPVTGGQTYRLKASAWTGVTNMYRDITNLSFPYTIPNVVSITESSLGTGYYYFFYNWSVSTLCESARSAVTATVNPDPNCSMSTTETDAAAVLSLYPNPFSDVLNIENVKDVMSITVSDMSGRTVRVIEKPAAQLHLAELKSGMYIVTLRMKDGSIKAAKAIKK